MVVCLVKRDRLYDYVTYSAFPFIEDCDFRGMRGIFKSVAERASQTSARYRAHAKTTQMTEKSNNVVKVAYNRI